MLAVSELSVSERSISIASKSSDADAALESDSESELLELEEDVVDEAAEEADLRWDGFESSDALERELESLDDHASRRRRRGIRCAFLTCSSRRW